jgi:type IV pilus assembly protein PilB
MQFAEEPATAAESASEDLQVSSLQDMATQAPVVRLVNSVLSQAVRDGASDIHISPEQARVSVRFRIDGKLHEVPAPPKSMLLPIISRFKILAGMDIATTRIPQDGRFTVRMEDKEINIRASAIPTIYGENLVLRLLDMGAGHYTLDRLGMFDDDREKIESAIYKPYGMILSTGPTGSGKSTSLYAILRRVNKPDINIITLEDPVEYRVERIRQIQLNRKAGMTFAGGLRSILRQDPDVIMVGEIRDSETAVIGVQAAMTGHRVLSTIHTNDAAGAITRLIDMGIEPFLVSSVLLVSFAQRLVRTVCPYCKEPYQPPERALKQFGLIELEGANFQRGKGCFNCMNTGYKGRIGVFEILLIDDMVQEMILKKQPAPEITRTAQQAGRLRTLKEDAAIKVFKGITTLEEAASAVMA